MPAIKDRKKCTCDKPYVYENVTGVKGDVCKNCEGVVEPSQPTPGPIVGPSDIGSLLIMYQDAIERLGFRNDYERQTFIQQLGKTAQGDLRQKLLMWRSNHYSQVDLQEAEALDKARRKSV